MCMWVYLRVYVYVHSVQVFGEFGDVESRKEAPPRTPFRSMFLCMFANVRV